MVFVLIDSSYYSYTVKVMLSTYKKRIIDVKIQILKSYKGNMDNMDTGRRKYYPSAQMTN